MPTQIQSYWGKFSRGQYLNVIINPDEVPDDVPVVKFWLEGSSLVEAQSIPIIKSPNNTFFFRKLIDGNYLDGNYCAVMRFTVALVDYTSIGYFQVQGGVGTAAISSMIEIDRTLGRGVVMFLDDGEIKIGYKPRLDLP